MARFTQGGGSGDGSALNYVQVVGTQQIISTAPNAIVDLNITTTGKPVQISVTGEGANASAGSWLRLNLFRDNVEIGNAIQLESSGASENVPFAINFIDDIQAGTYNYSARVTTINGGNWTFGEAAGPVMNAVELTGFKGDRGPRGFTGEQGPQGEPGEGSDADIADFVFNLVEDGEDTNSSMTIHNHDMRILTTRDGEQDADIDINSADDVWITANDTVEISSSGDDVVIYTNDFNTSWRFKNNGGLDFPDGTTQTTAYTGGDTASHGNFVFQDSNLSVYDSTMQIKAYGADEVTVRGEVILNPASDSSRFRVYDDQTQMSFDGSNWATATWTSTGETSSQLALTGASGVYNYFDVSLRDFNQAISINGNTPGKLDGWGSNGTDITIYILDMPVGVDPVVNSIDIYSAHASTILLDYDDNEMHFDAQNMNINMTTTGNRDINITSADDMTLNAAGDDMNIRATSEIRFTANNNISNKNWTMDIEGRFQLPGDGYISNPQQSSGDGNNNDTIHIVPDNDLNSDQYLIIDPTGPDHIHIRPGGNIDSSTADLILGGEMNNVIVSDQSRDVSINTRKATVINTYLNTNSASSVDFITGDSADITYGAVVNVNGIDFTVDYMMFNSPEPGLLTVRAGGAVFEPSTQYTFVFNPTSTNEWRFETDGKIYGPGEDGALILGGELLTTNNMSIRSTGESVVLNGAIGEFLGSSDNASSQIATIGDVATAVGVGGNGEVTRWTPNFTATGLAFTGTDSTHPTYTSHYVKNGRMVSFWIAIDLATVTNFGTGQYKTELPFAPLTGTMNHFQAWANVDPLLNPDIAGHVVLQADHLADTSVLDLHYLKQAGGANSPLMEAMFIQGSPATLTTSSKIYINGTYITAE